MASISNPDATAERYSSSLRHKRRASSSLAGSPFKPEATSSTGAQNAAPIRSALKPALLQQDDTTRTPRNKKRVRFSYPCDPIPSAAESTGITPFVARTTLVENSNLQGSSTRPLRQPAKRRRSAPAMQNTSWENTLQLSSQDIDTQFTPLRNIEVQFAPIRQILSDRTKRRLARRRVSETMNEIEKEQRLQKAQAQELAKVKKEVGELRRCSELSTMQSERIRELEGEIQTLKNQVTNDAATEIQESVNNDSDASEDVVLLDSGCGSPDNSMPITPMTPTSIDSPATPCTSASVQTDFTAEAMNKLHAHFNSQVKALSQARLELEHIIPGETPLPLSSPTEHISLWETGPRELTDSEDESSNMVLADARPLLDAVLQHIRSMHSRVTKTTKDLSISEKQRMNVVGNFRAALRQLDEARLARAKLLAESQSQPQEPSQPKRLGEKRSITDDDIRECELEEATKQLKQLQKNADLYERDRAKLVAALNKYRSEMKDMESLVGTLETEHALALQDFKEESTAKIQRLLYEHGQAVDDLEARVAAETKGRHEAEAEIENTMIRWADQRLKGEREVGTLNVKIADLDEEVKHRGEEVTQLREELSRLQEHVRSFFGHLGGNTLSANVENGLNLPLDEPSLPFEQQESSKDNQRRPARVGNWGLLTPHVEGGRFKNFAGILSPELSSDASVGGDLIPGEIQLERGKRKSDGRHDSGIGILMEADNEE